MPVVVAIMQPTYLPWIGYFDLIDQSDVFVFLDTVAFSRQSWQQRNRILTRQGVQWLTVPVRHAQGAPIREIEIDSTRPWRRKHWATLEAAYRRSLYWPEHSEPLAEIYRRDWRSLADLDICLIEALAGQVGVEARFVRASALSPASRSREGALVDLCLELGATTYLSPPGSFSYLRSDSEFLAHGIDLRFQHFEHPVYPQQAGEFVPYLSAIDLSLNMGPDAGAVLRTGRRAGRSVEEMDGA